MDHSGRMSLSSFVEENKISSYHVPAEPRRLSLSHLSAGTASPWSLSPLHHTTPNNLSLIDDGKNPPISPSTIFHCLATLHRLEGNVHSISISHGLVFTTSDSGRVRVWGVRDCLDRGYINMGHGRGHVLSMLAHGTTVITAHVDRRIRIWGVASDSNTRELDHDLARIRSKKIATLPSKSYVASFFPLFLGKSYRKVEFHKDVISCIAYNNREELVYTGSRDGTVKAWKVTEQRCTDTFIAHEGQINAMLVKHDEGCLFTACSNGSMKIWRCVYGDGLHTLIMVLKFLPSPVNALALSCSATSCFLYSGCSDGYVNIWEKEDSSGRFNHAGFLQGHRFAVLCLETVGDQVVLSGSEDTTIRVWKREKGSGFHSCMAVMEGHGGPVRCMAVSVDVEVEVEGLGFMIYSASFDRTVKVWRVKVLEKENEEEGKDSEENGGDKNEVEFEMNPVLSPSWVEKKLQRSLGY